MSAFSSIAIIAGIIWIFLNINMFSIICRENNWLAGWNPMAILVLSFFAWWFVIAWSIINYKRLLPDFKFKFYLHIITLVVMIIGILTMTPPTY